MQNRIVFILFFGIFFLKANIVSSQQKDIYNFSADKLTYSQDNNIIEATGNVVAKNQEGKQISADKIVYNFISGDLLSFLIFSNYVSYGFYNIVILRIC